MDTWRNLKPLVRQLQQTLNTAELLAILIEIITVKPRLLQSRLPDTTCMALNKKLKVMQKGRKKHCLKEQSSHENQTKM